MLRAHQVHHIILEYQPERLRYPADIGRFLDG